MTPDRWARVKALFQAAVDLPADRRAAFLAEACGDDLALRDEVASLVARHLSDEFLEVQAIAVDPDALEGDDPLVGRRLGSYDVVTRLGRGGMGVVYLARDLRLDRLVALKLVAPDAARDALLRARLAREARAAAALSHPGIATVYTLEDLDRGPWRGSTGGYARGCEGPKSSSSSGSFSAPPPWPGITGPLRRSSPVQAWCSRSSRRSSSRRRGARRSAAWRAARNVITSPARAAAASA